jgi:hypothetical protein
MDGWLEAPDAREVRRYHRDRCGFGFWTQASPGLGFGGLDSGVTFQVLLIEPSVAQQNKRPLLFTMAISPTQRQQLRAAAAERGVSAAELVREALRREGALTSN